MRLKRILQVLLLAVGLQMIGFNTANAQVVGIKSNLLGDVAASPNLGVEIGLAPKWSLDISGQVNAWAIKKHLLKHAFVQPEARYWFCQRFAGHFVAVNAIGGIFNVGNVDLRLNEFLGFNLENLKKYRYQGWGAGAGVAYGYAWPVAKHWNIEAEIGVGWIYTKYDKYPCADCGRKLESGIHRNYFGPTKAAVNVEYLF